MIREWIEGPVLRSRHYIHNRSSTENAFLCFILSMHLRRVEPDASGLYVSASGDVIDNVPWTDQEWRQFRHAFWNKTNRYWNNRFWLIPPAHFRDLDWPPGLSTHRPNVKCGIELRVHDRPEHVHLTIDCVHPQPGVFVRSSMGRTSGRGLLDPADVESNEQIPVAGEAQSQTTILHEIGHLLGLDHVNTNPSTCAAANAQGCYGMTTWQRGDLMGWGERLEPWHAWPWRDRIRHHTGIGGWRITMSRPAPTPLPRRSTLDAGMPADAGVPRAGGVRR